MNRFIPNLIRVQYALNCVSSYYHIVALGRGDKTAHPTSYLRETELPLNKEVNGTLKATNGEYIARIFEDVFEKTGMPINELNLRKRIMGVLKSVEEYLPMKKYRSALAHYCGRNTWKELERDAEALLEVKYKELTTSMSGTCQDSIGKTDIISLAKLHPGDKLCVSFKDGGSLEIEMMRENVFSVCSTRGTKLKFGDIINMSAPIVRNNRIYAEGCFRDGVKLGEYLSGSSVTDCTITFGIDSQKVKSDAIAERQRAVIKAAQEKRKKREKRQKAA